MWAIIEECNPAVCLFGCFLLLVIVGQEVTSWFLLIVDTLCTLVLTIFIIIAVIALAASVWEDAKRGRLNPDYREQPRKATSQWGKGANTMVNTKINTKFNIKIDTKI